MKRKLRSASSGIIALGVVLCIIVALNIILGNISLRVDLTEEKQYTLSQGSRNILGDLTAPLTLKFFFSSSDPAVPVFLKTYGRRVEDLLREYEIAGKGNVIIEKYDPQPDTEAEDWANKYGVAGRSLGMMGPSIYMGLVASMKGTEAVIPMLDPNSDQLLEYNITRMITRVMNPKKPVIGVLSSLAVMGGPPQMMPMMPGQAGPQPAWIAFQEIQKDYDVREVTPDADVIDGDMDALIVVHPKDLPDSTVYAIDQFLLNGGRVILFIDPLCRTESEAQTSPQMRFAGSYSDIPKLLSAWGVTYDAKKVVADLEAPTRLQTRDNRVEANPVWLSLNRDHLDREDILTSQLESLMMPLAGSFAVDPPEGISVTPLIRSSQSSGLVDAMSAQFSAENVRREFKSGQKRLPLALRLHGSFKTAFPDGPPAPSQQGEEEKLTARTAGLTQSLEPSSVIIVGDVDFLYDMYAVRIDNFMGMRIPQPRNDNLAFFANIIDQHVSSTDLVTIRSRGKTQRPFEVVVEKRRKAEEKYLQEEMQLQTRLQDAEQRLNALLAKKDQTQQLTLGPAERAELERFQEEVLKTRKELKLVRRKLREDIDALGMKIKGINILGMPVLVALVGVCFAYFRKRKTKA